MTDPRIKQIAAVDNANSSALQNDILKIESGGVNYASNPVVDNSPIGGTSLTNIVYSGSQTLSGVIEANNITINNSVVITVGASGYLHFKCRGNFTNNGTIDADGKGYVGVTSIFVVPHQRGCSAGGGGASGGSTGAGNATAGWDGADRIGLFNEGGAGAGGAFTPIGPNDGNNGSPSTSRPAWVNDLSFYSPTMVALGSGGGGGTAGASSGGAGGDGGAGGGIVIIEAIGNVVEGSIQAQGNDGSNGSNNAGAGGGGGGGGGGGMIIIIYNGMLTTGSTSVSGGAGGTGGIGTSDGDGGTGGAGENGIIKKIAI